MTIEQRLIASYGVTYVPKLAIWLLRDGTLVNGSYEGYQRDRDHREISEFFKPSVRQTPGSASIYIHKFMYRGNIRMSCSDIACCAEYAVTPSQNQLTVLCGIMDAGIRAGIETCIGKRNRDGRVIYRTYPAFIRHLYARTRAAIPQSQLAYAFDVE